MAKLTVKDLDVKGKRVLVRVDFNVPLDEKLSITDETRIVAALPTIRYLAGAGGRVILMSHLGRPKGTGKEPGMSLAPVAERLGELLGGPVKFAPDCIGEEVRKMVGGLRDGEVMLLENLRFHKEEEKNDPAFAKELSGLGELYVNDAFGTAHRAHASTEGVTKHIGKCAAGFLMQKELEYFGRALQSPERPFVAILGGAKVSDKIEVINNLMAKVDALLVGGAMSYTFLKAEGVPVGKSLVEDDKLPLAREIAAKAKKARIEFLLPEDHVIAAEFKEDAASRTVGRDGIKEGWIAVDIGPKTIKTYTARIAKAKTVVWNGPMGVFEMKPFAAGTMAIAKALAASKGVSIVGGGDSVSAVNKSGVADKITHISTGGGASLEFLEGKTLPGVAALTEA